MAASNYRTALITGASAGIGAALARAMAREGTAVALCARRADQLTALAGEIGQGAIAIAADLTDPESAASAVREAERRLGPLDVVVANAGMSKNRKGQALRVDDVLPTLRLNVLGACATLTAALPAMIERGQGQLVGISSLAGFRGLPASAAYSASKAALWAFLQSLRGDLHGTGVSVTDIRPGFIATELTAKNKFPMPFLLQPDDAARLILRAIKRRRAVYAFPWPMAALVRLAACVPEAVWARAAPLVHP